MPVVFVFEFANTCLQLALLTLRRRVLLDLLLIHYLIDDCGLTDGCQALAVRREGHGADTSLKANSELALLRIERMVTSVGGALWHAIADVGLAGGILGVSTRELESDCGMGAQHFFLTD